MVNKRDCYAALDTNRGIGHVLGMMEERHSSLAWIAKLEAMIAEQAARVRGCWQFCENRRWVWLSAISPPSTISSAGCRGA
jgi:hypothetical protein